MKWSRLLWSRVRPSVKLEKLAIGMFSLLASVESASSLKIGHRERKDSAKFAKKNRLRGTHLDNAAALLHAPKPALVVI